ncbi:MAG: hypothetical protein ETSY2_42070 [Candidatus Entotheonella gemina]|uniref:Uncharacterized protein n=1 Tax=Candidatus Entotheonella gemina TaxID=1429439 RepID=W4LLS8_9BACT|nr:MAG: hypothetical protein ETSY2_42070 [Candidatus Entotheonella gemina]
MTGKPVAQSSMLMTVKTFPVRRVRSEVVVRNELRII